MLALGGGRRRGALRRLLRKADLPGRAGRVRREATAEQQAEHDSRRGRQAAGTPCSVARRLHGGLQFAATNSICSGRLASIRGPLRTSIQPRTRRRRFSSAFGREPGVREDALLTFRYGDRERLRPSAAEIHIYGAAAVADRQHFAFDDREMTLSGHQTRQIPAATMAYRGSPHRPILAVRATRSCESSSAAHAGSPAAAPTRAWPRASMAWATERGGSPAVRHRQPRGRTGRALPRRRAARRSRRRASTPGGPCRGSGGERFVRGGNLERRQPISRPSSSTKLRPSMTRSTRPAGMTSAPQRDVASWDVKSWARASNVAPHNIPTMIWGPTRPYR